MAPPHHWILVSRRIGLQQRHMLRLRLAMQLYARMAREAAAEGEGVLQSMASLSISRALEGVGSSHASNGSAAGRSSSRSSRAPAGKAAAAAAAAAAPLVGGAGLQDGAAQIAEINSQLQRHMRLRSIQSMAISMFCVDNMSRLQIAEMLLGEHEYFIGARG
ncbi:hypothetical protein OEZ85_003235 [Tetradesmus obliquus]|uniref:Uncharacterized protein n=1 Tax=Tetradesmus obliquus TaxID=3088 RepID=A0ABY8U2S4_TETOB|nr:hypothetical protein OEZ85_003233 [Tetradesmus obliquus]WIA14749.1 hypothetical protein OEZ85_003235 [Tetradesmus obliquus]